MRVALCLSGQPRFVEKAYPYIYNNLIVPNCADVFFHTWFAKEDVNKSYRNDTGWTNHPNNKIPENTEELLLNLYKPKAFLFEKQKTFKNKSWNVDKTIQRFCSHLNRDYFVDMMHCMWYSIHKANAVKEIYRYEQDVVYDYVIRCRFDAIIPRVLNCMELDPNIIHVSHDRQQPNMLDDWFAVSSTKNMNVYTDCYNLMDAAYDIGMKRDGLVCNEILIHDVVKQFGILADTIPNFKIEFVRPWT
jgi:hypothetical protein